MQPALTLTLQSADHGGAPILGALRLEVWPGETVALTGPSGVGKTTLLRILAGLHRGWQGRLHLPGRVAMVFQDPVLLPWRSALDNIRIPAACSAPEAQAALDAVDLGGRAEAFPGALSLGQQRRLALARAFAARPDVLLLDEAFVSLDAALAAEMMALFERLRAARNLATVLVTHAAPEAERLASRILVLSGQPARLSGAA